MAKNSKDMIEKWITVKGKHLLITKPQGKKGSKKTVSKLDNLKPTKKR